MADSLVAIFALWAAFELRFDRPADYSADLPLLAALLVACRLASTFYFRLHRWSFKFSSLRDGARVVLAGVVGSMLFVLAGYVVLRSLEQDVPARGVVALEMLLSTAGMGILRFAPRLGWMYRADLWGRRRGERTLIVGAGSSGETLLRDLQRSDQFEFHVVGFVDDDRSKWGHILGGKPVLGGTADLPRLAEHLRVQRVVIAIPGLAPSRLRQILSLGFSQQVRFAILPIGYGFPQGRDLSEALRDVSTEDLLARPELVFEERTFEDFRPPSGGAQVFDPGGTRLVAGAAGSIGSEVCTQLLALGARRLVMVDTDENGLYMLRRRLVDRFPDRELLAEVGDIRDRQRLRTLFHRHRPRDVFHAAARKHVPLMEAAPCEAVKTNVFGTENLLDVARETGVERFVFTSTDKAVRPTSVMGASKRLGEMLVGAADDPDGLRAMVVRFGNVLDSAGSVVPVFREQIAAGGPVTVTHPDIQRYFMTISEAVGLVLRAAYGDHGPLCVLEMGEPIRVVDLARQMITLAGLVPDVDIRIEYTGLRPGEKL
ncbi:MAG: nucleoside-diphosphate sugar epimerase/dehydratase, partial [Acidobacteriota bacterium]